MVSRQIIVNEQLLHFYHLPNENGNTLLFLHGWRSDSTTWFALLKELQKNSRDEIICLDLPGFGRSESPKKEFSLGDYRDIVEQFIEKQRIINPVLIGHSFGGRIVIKMAAGSSSKYKKIILVDSAGIKPKPKKFLAVLAKIVKPLFAARWMQPLRQKIYRHLGAEDYVATPSLQATYTNIINEDLSPLLQKITADALLIWGENDTDTPVSDAHQIKQALTKSALHIIEGAGHYPFVEQPALVAQKIQSFLQKT